MTLHSYAVRMLGALALLGCCDPSGLAVRPAHAEPSRGASWGAIASVDNWYGYAFNFPSRDAAELAARSRCERAAGGKGRGGACVVRTYFDRSCGALARGNYGEWGTAVAATASEAAKAAAGQCETHLPTEPCKVVVSVCSPG
ncbi:hypothetical protein H4CHR_02607 [Variovorax sp. PBS-H4]|uniref:DUF4189 domain-containing protein n=1 Tax=Variovorax sp. PBS-H4 TaxID=434008 RepID=UPI001318A8FE|nr:DUF4189 domain-containing protein [Variovorax sp. PBS-H4]VTU30437.1 hypothetical protein H4CHR_02607 [Variovorax sp. PBS-H4]